MEHSEETLEGKNGIKFPMNAAQFFVRCLENEGVKYIFGIPGEENIRMVDAFNGSPIRFILVRHEQAASFMADIYGRLTGQPGVCIATLGPGAINLMLGTADANTDNVPLVAISAQVGLNRIYKESHQIVDLVNMFKPLTKWAALIQSAEAIPEMVRSAFKQAQTERHGAVYLAFPQDVESLPAPEGYHPLDINIVHDSSPSATQIARAVKVLEAAKKPIVLAGHGAVRDHASEALIHFSERLRISVATTFMGKGVFPDNHPNSLGAAGFMLHDYVNFGFDQADVVICVGYDLQEFDPVRINPKGDKQIIHIHRYPAEVDAHYHVMVGIEGSISESFDALSQEVKATPGLSPIDTKITRLIWGKSWRGEEKTTHILSSPRGSSQISELHWMRKISYSLTQVRSRCGWPVFTPRTGQTRVLFPTVSQPWPLRFLVQLVRNLPTLSEKFSRLQVTPGFS
jgi:acetolactate synthase-1/2/3 large subunit